jgi:hypothetical protein
MTGQIDLLTVTNTLIGLISGDAGTRTGKNGSAFATFSVATKNLVEGFGRRLENAARMAPVHLFQQSG